MGMLGAAAMPPDVLQAAIRDIKAVEPACFGVNFIARFSAVEHIEVCVTEKVPVVVFFWMTLQTSGFRGCGRLALASGSRLAAWMKRKRLSDAGPTRSLCKGSEAGGHNRATAATFSLLPAVIDAVPSVPVVAAGGIADGRTVAAALALGADAVWVGTSPTRELRGLCPSGVQRPGRRCGRRGYCSPSDLWP